MKVVKSKINENMVLCAINSLKYELINKSIGVCTVFKILKA
jgi:hypothetical protein